MRIMGQGLDLGKFVQIREQKHADGVVIVCSSSAFCRRY